MTRIPLLLAALLVAAAPALAQSIDSVSPACGAPGDKILIEGSGFGESPAVTIGDEDAKVLKSDETRILVEIPELEAGSATIDVDGATFEDFTVLDEGAPLVRRLSSSTATPGQVVILIGKRLHDADAEFVDADGEVAGTAELKGRYRIAALMVPDDLEAGEYKLRIVNGDGADNEGCEPLIEIVEAGDPALDAISPEEQLPGRMVEISGSDLGPFGYAKITWTDEDGNELVTFGFANGYDTIYTRVPFKAVPGGTYDVQAEFKDGGKTDTAAYTVGTIGAPTIDEISPAKGPAGSLFVITGENLVAKGSDTKVEMTSGETTLEAEILFAKPGFGNHSKLSHGGNAYAYGHTDALLVQVPSDAEEGEYDVTVTVGEETSDGVTFEVGDLPLAVDFMKPNGQSTRGSFRPVAIGGTGFGSPDGAELKVVWSMDEDEREGTLVYRSDRLLIVIPPGGKVDPLDEGVWDVTVVLDPDGDADSADAGEYTVKSYGNGNNK